MSAEEPNIQSRAPQQAAAPSQGSVPFALAERAAKFGYWRYDITTGEDIWSPGMYRQIGMEPNDSIPREIPSTLQTPPEQVEAVRQIIDKAVREKTAFYYRMRVTALDGQEKIFETHGDIELGPDGQPVSVVGVRHDITDLVAAEAAYRHAEEMYRVMAEQASDIIILFDANSELIHASPALERVLKRTPAEASNKNYHKIIHPDDLAEAAKLERTAQTGETVTATYRARHGDGHYIWIESTMRAVYDETGKIQNVIAVTRDITERQRREFEIAADRDRAEAANLAKSTFLANMSHELRTPLNAIIGFADMMRKKMFGPLGAPRYDEYVRLIHESGQLLLDLISDVLDMSKIEAGKLQLHVEEVDLHRLVHDCMHLLEERAAKADVRIDADLPDEPLSIEGDRRALKQILLNLLSNAVKFTLAGGTIAIRIVANNETVVLTVADSGIGISAEDLPRLGRPFEQASNDPTVANAGTGLGLALVYALAAKHGGCARIESEEGMGTTVTVELPRTQDAAQAAA